MTIKELLKQLLDCDVNDDLYIHVITDGESTYYSTDGLENSMFEFRKNPTLATLKVKR